MLDTYLKWLDDESKTRAPRSKLYEYMDKKFGNRVRLGLTVAWPNITIHTFKEEDEDDMEEAKASENPGPDKINWDFLSGNPGLFEVMELIEKNKHLDQRQRFAFAKLISNTSTPLIYDIIQKILEDKPEPTLEARLANIRR
jgi:hypothetical protein